MDSLRQSRFLSLLMVLAAIMVDVTSALCTNVRTSEGIVDLKDGAYACAPLLHGQPESELGSRFLWCAHTAVYEYSCGALRWDSKASACNWPALRNCGTASASASSATTTEATTAESPIGKNKKLTTCSELTCQLPDCFCSGATPTGVGLHDTPMFVMVTFDDAVTSPMASAIYNEFLIENSWNLTNPNGCPPQVAFFVSHKYTEYGLVETLYQAGNEIASHTVNHTSGESSYTDVLDEIQGQRDNIALHTSIPEEEIVGFRSPFLKIYGDVQYQILSDRKFLYDSSLFNVEIFAGRKPLWPFTLDYPVGSRSCLNTPCPSEPHPGVWEVPLNGWVGDNGFSCSMLDACSIDGANFKGTKDDYLRFFRRNFYENFYPNKVPMHMFTHASIFLRLDGAKEGFRAFLEEITKLDDVWLVTPSQVLAWMKSPVSNQQLKTFRTRSCHV